MFKSLLRTIPTLSGNVTLNCYVNDYIKTNRDEFIGYVKHGELIPLQNELLNKKINISLLYGSYEFDIATYYKYYNSKFYQENFVFNKFDYQYPHMPSNNDIKSVFGEILDSNEIIIDEPIKYRNKDYEFGCKRIPYLQQNCQYSFYAPIYCDSYESLPDYFEIKIIWDSGNFKTIKIKIKDRDNQNHLRYYLQNYLNKINNNVIDMLPLTKQAAYDGINVLKGGFSKVEDSIISQLYNKQMTFNNFDYIICDGFKRNNLIVKQILPLSFSFNINDILNEKEKIWFKNSKIKIVGHYVKSGIYYNFSDFDINYTDKSLKSLSYDWSHGKYINHFSENIYDVNDLTKLSLHEKDFIGYKYSNKITPMYNKWKLKYSSNEFPYIFNNNYIMSYLQYNNKYGLFPYISNTANPKAKQNNYDLILPYGNIIRDNYYLDYEYNTLYPLKQYIEAMNNYISNWYVLFDNNTGYDSNNYLNEEFLYNDSIWEDVDDNKCYYKGILYNLNNIFNDINQSIKLDKFGIFLNLNLTNISENDLIDKKYVYCNYIIKNSNNNLNDFVNTNTVNNSLFNLYNSLYLNIYNCEVKNNYIMELNNKYGNYIEFNNYYKYTSYYSYTDLYKNLDNILSIVINKMFNDLGRIYTVNKYNITNNITDKIKFENNIIINNGYTELPIYNNSNLFDDDNFILNNINNIENIINNINLYYTLNNNVKTKITDKLYVSNNIENQISLFYTDKYIFIGDAINSIYDFIVNNNIRTISTIMNKASNNTINIIDIENYIESKKDNIKNYIIKALEDSLQVYNYIPIDEQKFKVNNQFFRLNRTYNENIWVDTYNLKNILGDKYNEDNLSQDEYYGKFLNKDHILEYIKVLNDKNLSSDSIHLSENIYVRERHIYINDNESKPYYIWDEYTSLYDILNRENLKYIDNINFINDIIYNYNDGLFEIKYKDNIKICDLYFKKRFYKLDNTIKDKLFDNEGNVQFYLYILNDDPKDIKELITYKYLSEDISDKNIVYKNNINSVKPLFSSIYVTGDNNLYIKSLIDRGLIYNNSDIYYYNEEKIPAFIDINYYNSLYDIKLKILYLIYNIVDNKFLCYSIEEIENNIYLTDDIKLYLINNYKFLYSKVNKLVYKNKYVVDKYILEIIYDDYDNIKKDIENDNSNIYNLSYIKEFYEFYNNIYNLIYTNTFKFNNENNCILREYVLNNKLYISNNNEEIKLYTGRSVVDLKLKYFNEDDVINKKYNNIGNLLNLSQYNFNIFNRNDKYYGYYLIDLYLDNTNKTFRVNNSSNGIIPFRTINNNDLESELYINFKYIQPFIEENMFNNFINSIKTVVYPIKTSYKQIYQWNNKDKNIDIVNNKSNNIKLTRYFNSINFILEDVNNNMLYNCYNLKYKSIMSSFSDSNIEETNNINIYKYPGVKLYNNINNVNYINYNEVEYKHYNDNLLYNLEEVIIIEEKQLVFEEEKNNLLNINEAKKYFKNYLKDLKNNSYNKNQILFLFNRYKLEYLSDFVKIDAYSNKKLFKIKYKFTLK